MPGFLTDNELKALLTDSQQRQALDGLQDSMITRASVWAYGQIVRAFAWRGFSRTLVDQWDYGRDYQTDLVFWKVCTELARNQPDTWSKEALDKLDRREDLKEAALLINGNWTWPDTRVGQVTIGPEDTSGDRYGLDPDDPRIGEVTRF